MNDSSQSDIDLDAMMREIRAEVARRRALVDGSPAGPAGAQPSAPAPGAGPTLALPRLPDSSHRLEAKDRYTLADFLQFHDEQFVRNAYHGVLRRAPDGIGFESFLSALREGRLSKAEIVGRMRFSREGRAFAVRIVGLPVAFALRTLRRVPLLGRIVGIVQYVIRLPEIVRNHERLEAVVFQREQFLNRHLNQMEVQIESAVGKLEEAKDSAKADHDATESALESLDSGKADREEFLGRLAALDERKSDRADVGSLLQAVEVRMHELRAVFATSIEEVDAHFSRVQQSIKAAIATANVQPLARLEGHDRELVRLESVLNGVELVLREHQRNVARVFRDAGWVGEEGRAFDAFYVDFENHFRGTPEDIRARLSVYLPAVKAAGIGGSSAPLVDLGCGRGEWLQLVKEQGLHARGVDTNGAMAALCREQGLDVVETDAVAYLKAQPAGSLGGVTAIHLVEHVSFANLLALFDESLRALQPNGVLVFETPNPENLVVGACSFYLDPTHRNPLPPTMLQFVAEARGFERVETLRLHPSPGAPLGPDGSPLLPQAVEALLYGPRDYAILAYKPQEATPPPDDGSARGP